jgi:hypothetical protein
MLSDLGRFGDSRLQKGGPSFWNACRHAARAASGCAGWAETGPGRSGSSAS